LRRARRRRAEGATLAELTHSCRGQQMDDPNKHYWYIKFRINPDIDIMDALFISEDKHRVDHWQAEYSSKNNHVIDHNPTARNTFKGISNAFEQSIEEFQTTVPFIMRTIPLLLDMQQNRSIREFVQRHGEPLGKGSFETYRLTIDYIDEINNRLKTAAAIAKGATTLPDMFLVGLISAYDVFLSDLIKMVFSVQPELLSSSERNISYKDLVEIGSVEAARERIIEKEVETQIRKSHVEQVQWLSSKVGMPLTKELKIWPEFIELCERRNLLTHTGGTVSSQYITICNQHGIDTCSLALGQKLAITQQYYARAVDIIFEMGIKLTQVIWRKLIPDDINVADHELGQCGYRLIARRRYRAAATMFRFGLYEMKKHGPESIRRRMVVNYANALKMSGDKTEARRVLDEEDWSASGDEYGISVAAVKDDTETVIFMMKRVVGSGKMELRNFREWPVFENIRKDPKFVEEFEKEFGEKLIVDKETRSAEIIATGLHMDEDAAETVSDENKVQT
jgi:hypothetical protein